MVLFLLVFLISFKNSTVRRKRSVDPRDRPGSCSETINSQATIIFIKQIKQWIELRIRTWVPRTLYGVQWNHDQQRCSPVPLFPWLSQPLAPLHCPSLPKSLDDHVDYYSVVKISISAYSRTYPGTRSGNQLMQHRKKLYAATGQAQISSANSHFTNPRG